MRLLLSIVLFASSLASHAVSLSEDEAGQVLLFPIVTTHGGFNTLLSISNLDDGRRVVARLVLLPLEGEPIPSNLLLLPGETFSAAIAGGRMVTGSPA